LLCEDIDHLRRSGQVDVSGAAVSLDGVDAVVLLQKSPTLYRTVHPESYMLRPSKSAWGTYVRIQIWGSAALIALAIMPGFTSATMAQTSREWTWCMGDKGISLDLQIGGCTTVIQSGRLTKENLEIAFRKRATAYFYKPDFDRAIQDYSEVIKLNPGDATAFDNRCWTRATVGLLREALADCDQSLRLRPNYESTLSTRGFVYLRSDELDKAIADYSASLNINPKNPYSLFGRGTAKLRKNDVGGNADIAAAKAVKPNIAAEFAGYGLK